MRVEFYGLRFDLPEGWTDITEDLPSGSLPSLARPAGVGAVQFSIANYSGGEEPNVTLENLRAFLLEFCQRNHMSSHIVDCGGKLMSVESSSMVDNVFILARYFSNGKDVVFATYVCPDVDNSEMEKDINGIGVIMNSMEF